ncbi:hypothetical protein ILUMI_10499 [Ignelater luminosus]|uniref:PiggyBac transposable element-derived protein domain-containing protein n=1 Tax=Ignelater luminosus TaxID=2038154 RepID=A0A8K0GBF1_IGNLU|nr:hypothetical protein ILUMI_10499 [Ignelater luminosus]
MKRQGRGTAKEFVRDDGEVILTKWLDNEAVRMASNYMSVGTPNQCRRWDKTAKEYVNIPRPVGIRHYNDNMGENFGSSAKSGRSLVTPPCTPSRSKGRQEQAPADDVWVDQCGHFTIFDDKFCI